jgi:predicted nucleotidyltransferase
MLTKEHIARLLLEQNAYLANEFGVRRIGLFGSASRGQSGEGSDIDLVVEFERPIGLRFMELGDYLESLLGHKVDLLTPAGIQAIRSQTIRQEISESIVYV